MKIRNMLIATTAAAAATGLAAPAQAQDFYLGQVIATAGQYCPPGFLEPAGQILPIGQYTALFAVIGPVFGGDGRTNFGLPDLRGRGIVQWGQGPGLLPIQFGASIGADQVSLSLAQLAPHAHTGAVIASTAAPTAPNPAGNVLATFPASPIYGSGTPGVPMKAGTVQTDSAGGGLPIPIRNPDVALRYCIVSNGLYPPRP